MAQREVQGKDILLMIDPLGGTAYDTIVCLTSNGITMATNTINSSSKCGTSSSPGSSTFDVPFEGNYMLDPDSGNISGADLFTLAKNKTNFSWQMGPAIPAIDDIIYTGTGFLSGLTIQYPAVRVSFTGVPLFDAMERVGPFTINLIV